jgi:hypothetical protein
VCGLLPAHPISTNAPRQNFLDASDLLNPSNVLHPAFRAVSAPIAYEGCCQGFDGQLTDH